MGGIGRTILDLAHTGLEVVDREVAHFFSEAVEIHDDVRKPAKASWSWSWSG